MNTNKSVFQLGAENGISFGLYLSAIFLLLVYGNASLILNLVGLILIFAIPLRIFRYMRKFHVSQNGNTNYSQVWTLGMLTFLCGSLICALVTYIWLDFIKPDFIYEQAMSVLAVYEQKPELRDNEFVKILRQAIEDKLLPTPIEFVFQMLSFSFSAGVILSFLLSPFARIGGRRKNVNNNQ